MIKRVDEWTGRVQKADFYPPDYINPRLIRIFEPQPRPSVDVAKVEPVRRVP